MYHSDIAMIIYDPFSTNMFVESVYAFISDLVDLQKLPKVCLIYFLGTRVCHPSAYQQHTTRSMCVVYIRNV